jgi:NADH dehydrogenase
MTARTTVVFGGTGFLGRAIVRALTARGDTVRVAARRPNAAGMPPGVELRRADIQDDAAVAAAVEGAETVVNAVSLYVEGGGLDFDGIHVEGATRLARVAHSAGVERIIHVSGIGVTEESPSPYVRARARGEMRVREMFPGASILRPSVLFGPDDSFLATLDNVTRLPVVPLFGRGNTRLQPVHVEDVAAAVAGAAHTADATGRVFELGGNEVLHYREIVQAVLSHRRRWRPLLPVPWAAWRGIAYAGKMLSNPPLTIDQIVLMQADNIVSVGMATFADLGIEARGLHASLTECLPG